MNKKLIAPVVITILMVLLLLGYACLYGFMPFPFKLIGLIPLGLLGVSAYVLVERIREIRSGEEDDLSQY